MKVMLVGSGGREHAIATKVLESPLCESLVCVPGNGGMEEICECVPASVMDFPKLIEIAKERGVDFAIIAPDDPLAAGAVDAFTAAGIRAFGPTKAAARIEGSKAFSKDLMRKYGIPTAAYEVFDSADAALEYLKTAKYPLVLKADGLALGKGVLICENLEQAEAGVAEIMLDKKFGDAGTKMVVEEFLTGREASVLCFCDGETILPMTSAMDHKRALDGDRGLNTGGMGNVSPNPFYTDEIAEFCMEKVYGPTMDAMKREGCPFTGVLFVGLMLTEDGAKVLEYNARFGDPEAQVVLPRMKSDLLEIMLACVEGRLADAKLEFDDGASACVVLSSGGYPVAYEKGKEIVIDKAGLDRISEEIKPDRVYVYHAGTAKKDGKLVTSGGRVIGVTATAPDLETAIERAYKAANRVEFEGKFYRKDIGKAALEFIKK